MSPILASILTGAITTFGRWARGKTLDMNTVIGVVVLAITLTLIEQANEKLAKAFALLVVVAVSVAHVGVILDATGLIAKKNPGSLPKG